MVQAIAGYNSTNRWTAALNIPAEENGDFFRKADAAQPKVELDSFVTPTSPGYSRQVSSVAPLKPEMAQRPPLEPFVELEKYWQKASSRQPILPMAEGKTAQPWVGLLKVFPVANQGRINSLLAAESKGKLDARTKLLVAWTCAREDRAWYMQNHIARRMTEEGVTKAALRAIDSSDPNLSEKDKAVIALARKMTVAPWFVTDADVASVRKHFTDYQVAEIVLHACNAACLDRVTEVSQLPVEKPLFELKP